MEGGLFSGYDHSFVYIYFKYPFVFVFYILYSLDLIMFYPTEEGGRPKYMLLWTSAWSIN